MSGDFPDVSVCIPVFNGGAHIRFAIESALAQTWKNIEVLVVDNDSSDETVAIAKHYAATDPRLVVIRNERNLGMVANWNRCLSYARGEWIKFLFHDDVLVPTCVERMLESADGAPIVACRRNLIDADGARVKGRNYYTDHAQRLALLFRQHPYLTSNQVCRLVLDSPGTNFFGEPSSLLFHVSLPNRFGPFNEDLIMECDSEWWYRVAVNTGIRLIDEELGSFRIHEMSASTEAQQRRYFRYRFIDRLVVLRQMLFNEHFQLLRDLDATAPGPKSLRLELFRTMRSARRHITHLAKIDSATARDQATELATMVARFPDMVLPYHTGISEQLIRRFRHFQRPISDDPK